MFARVPQLKVLQSSLEYLGFHGGRVLVVGESAPETLNWQDMAGSSGFKGLAGPNDIQNH